MPCGLDLFNSCLKEYLLLSLGGRILLFLQTINCWNMQIVLMNKSYKKVRVRDADNLQHLIRVSRKKVTKVQLTKEVSEPTRKEIYSVTEIKLLP